MHIPLSILQPLYRHKPLRRPAFRVHKICAGWLFFPCRTRPFHRISSSGRSTSPNMVRVGDEEVICTLLLVQ